MRKKLNVKERARRFAINAHNGQVRKSEPDKPLVIHSIEVANILEEYGLDDNVVAAGYLHDVVEDTNYEAVYILEKYGFDIANLVMKASEPDKSFSWEERKIHTIETVKTLPLRNKLLICADKISNLESLLIKFNKTGKRDFSAFKRGEEKQKWYYTSVYESLIFGEDENHPMFRRLKDVIDKVFYNKEDTYLRDVIFSDRPEYYEKLKELHARKEEIKKISKLVKLPKPFVIEFAGTPRTGKTGIFNNLKEFFEKAGFKVKAIEEFTTSKYYKEVFEPNKRTNLKWGYNIAIIEEVNKQLQEALLEDVDIILIDRSLNDRQIWNYRLYKKNGVADDFYLSFREKYTELSKSSINFLLVTYADSIVAVKRDYENSITLEERKFINQENIDEYNEALLSLQELFKESTNYYMFLDTTSVSKKDVMLEVATQLMIVMRNSYLNAFIEDIHQYIGKPIYSNY